MKKFNLYGFIFLAIITIFSFSTAKAQNRAEATNENAAGRNRRGEVLEQLGLTGEQLQQYRRINAEKRPLLRAAQLRLKEATRALDEAIYADALDEATIQARIKDAQTAQAEVIKLRTQTELAVRRILSAEQLTRFREARRRFAAEVEERQQNKQQNQMPGNLNRRFGNRRPPAENQLNN